MRICQAKGCGATAMPGGSLCGACDERAETETIQVKKKSTGRPRLNLTEDQIEERKEKKRQKDLAYRKANPFHYEPVAVMKAKVKAAVAAARAERDDRIAKNRARRDRATNPHRSEA